jgi:hypothetical protein
MKDISCWINSFYLSQVMFCEVSGTELSCCLGSKATYLLKVTSSVVVVPETSNITNIKPHH